MFLMRGKDNRQTATEKIFKKVLTKRPQCVIL
nr:MAG TPA: hypothetical protein [Caudoviricetes sp.]